MTEDEWWDQCQLLRSEVEATVHSFYMWKHINNIAVENKAALREMNRNPEFWTMMMHSFQTTFFITIGRVFDKDPRSHSIRKLLTEMAIHPEFFFKGGTRTAEAEVAELSRGVAIANSAQCMGADVSRAREAP